MLNQVFVIGQFISQKNKTGIGRKMLSSGCGICRHRGPEGLGGFIVFQIIAGFPTASCFVAPKIVILIHSVSRILEFVEEVAGRWVTFWGQAPLPLSPFCL